MSRPIPIGRSARLAEASQHWAQPVGSNQSLDPAAVDAAIASLTEESPRPRGPFSTLDLPGGLQLRVWLPGWHPIGSTWWEDLSLWVLERGIARLRHADHWELQRRREPVVLSTDKH